MTWLTLLILSFVEGLTEFLPISSTGHLILTSALLGLEETAFLKAFNIMIQAGAIFAIVVLYWRRLLPDRQLYSRIFAAFLPAAVIGLIVKKKIDLILGDVRIVGASLIVGGIILLIADRLWNPRRTTADSSRKVRTRRIEDLSLKEALALGFIQCFAFVPGVSRAGATIVGGMALGLSSQQAAEFSFFLAVPTLMGASLVKGLTAVHDIDSTGWIDIALGGFLSFVFAMIAIRYFLRLLQNVGLAPFGYYRIVVGILIFLFV